ncbi:PspA/IM30 family protein [Paenibacillus spiritus]|uniref:PspA/IM30 family protein n=1 Tax=Paenibacillus spiritus TaxID=2496557 RepID=A0A5J5GKM2_9BACL|nr:MULTISPECIES: PspA/IM30 family protein [Paenibacillus]KAA9008670.1 PspA/IM30 family protein [Paenibacillus spiritus]
MSVFRRMRDITVANLNERLEQAQDPVKLIDQFLHSTRQEISEVEALYNQYSQHTKQLQSQVNQAAAMRDKREEQAMLALKAGEENLAKLALQEKIIHEEKLEQYSGLLDQSRQSLMELEGQLSELKLEYQTVYSKRQYYAARMESLRLQQRMNARSAALGGNGDVPKMFGQLEDRLADWELEAKSLRDLRRMGQEYATAAGETVATVLEREMAKLKEKLNRNGKE